MRKSRSSTYTSVRILGSSICFGLVFEDEKAAPPTFDISLPNTRPTELLVPGATTTTSTAGPPHPPISRVGLTAFVSRAACLRDTDTFGLELAEASLGRFVFQKKKNVMVYFTRTWYVPSF